MILTDEQMAQIVDLLLDRTRDRKLDWFSEKERLITTLPNQTMVELGKDSSGTDFVVQLKGESGVLLGQVKTSAEGIGSTAISSVRALYDDAKQVAAKTLFVEIVDSLKLYDSATAVVTRGTQPPQVTAVQAATVLQMMAGNWRLDFSRGKENATIYPDGSYSVSGEPGPKFSLKVLAWNEATQTAEIAKDWPNGKRLQIEFLKIAENEMTGHVKHDHRGLKYKRLGN